MALRFVIANPALSPLFAAVGLGVVGSVGFAGFYLSKSSDVTIRNKRHENGQEPWNLVQQGTNTKLFSYQPEFWKGRQGMAHPQTMFTQDGSSKLTSEKKISKAKAIQAARKETVAAH